MSYISILSGLLIFQYFLRCFPWIDTQLIDSINPLIFLKAVVFDVIWAFSIRIRVNIWSFYLIQVSIIFAYFIKWSIPYYLFLHGCRKRNISCKPLIILIRFKWEIMLKGILFRIFSVFMRFCLFGKGLGIWQHSGVEDWSLDRLWPALHEERLLFFIAPPWELPIGVF